jgi:hypothetical protein
MVVYLLLHSTYPNQTRLVVVPVLPSPSVETMTCKLCAAVLEFEMWSFSVVCSGWWSYSRAVPGW